MKLSRVSLIVALAIVAIVALSVSVSAYSNEDLATFITSPQMINGKQYKLKDADAVAAKDYLMKNPVSDAKAAEIKGLLDQAISKANSAGSLDALSSTTKAEIVDLLKQAGAKAGVTVNVNTAANTISVADANGAVIASGSYVANGNGGLTVSYSASGASTGSAAASNGGAKTFVYTGANGSVFAVIALVAVVAVSTVLVKKSYAK